VSPAPGRTRYAPSTTGAAHPGTLLSGLLCWLDARSRGGWIGLRLENLDHQRCKPELADAMVDDLAWLGLHWDQIQRQNELSERHIAALDRLQAGGLLYPCRCSRADRRASGRRSPDGGWAYDNRCRERALPAGGWREAGAAVRVRLPDRPVDLVDESGLDLSQHPARDMGDPIVVRRDGVIAYHLVVVVDDAADGVTRVIRGRDLATSTATQVLLHQLLELPVPTYRHHFLLLEPHGDKLAKLHGSIGAAELRAHYAGDELCGLLADIAGIAAGPAPVWPVDLVDRFDWAAVRTDDCVLAWDGEALAIREP
jgi:glutamyl/glutaminyl-tRNA synthetase